MELTLYVSLLTLKPGLIEKYAALLYHVNLKLYLGEITTAAAEKASRERRFHDTVMLYNVVGNQEAVLTTLNVELGSSFVPANVISLEQPAKSIVQENQAQLDIVSAAEQVLGFYQRTRPFESGLLRKAETTRLLIRMRKVISFYEDDRLQESFEVCGLI